MNLIKDNKISLRMCWVTFSFMLFSFMLFSQRRIDTTEIASIRYEYEISTIIKDTTLSSRLIVYKSGFYKKVRDFMNNFKSPVSNKTFKGEFGFFEIYTEKSEMPYSDLSTKKTYIMGVGDNLTKVYYDQKENVDSIVTISNIPESKKDKITFRNKYNKKDKPKFIVTIPTKDSINFKYNFFGKLKTQEEFENAKLKKIRYYKKNRLVGQKSFGKYNYKNKVNYIYNDRGLLIKEDVDDIFFYKYYYENDLLFRKEKLYKRSNEVINYTLFTYHTNGILKTKKKFVIPDDLGFGKKPDKLDRNFFYVYKFY